MKEIDDARLETDLVYRFEYLCDFIGFGEEDIAAIHATAPVLAPMVPALVDAVYDKLAGYTSTWRHFVGRGEGFEGEVATDVASLTMDHEQIAFRKNHLARYLEALVTRPYDEKMVKYLDMVGRKHTGQAGASALHIPLIQMNALLGWVADVFNATLLGTDLPTETKVKTLRAFSKLLWIQNDLVTRHYEQK